MRICILSDYTGIIDDGMRNTAYYLHREMSRRHDILPVCLRPHIKLAAPDFWRRIRAFQPDIIHLIPGPTIKIFLLAEALRINYRRAKIIMSATLPSLSAFSKKLVPRLKPNLVLTQSPDSETLFKYLGCQTKFLPGGVDTDTFAPVPQETRDELKHKYQLETSKWIVLHVGPIRKGRNLLLFNQIQKQEDTQVLIVGSVSVPMDKEVYRELIAGGCLVWHRYFGHIADVYALADCYVFPTRNRANAIETPLSVLEAMSCNLPVISTPFAALPRLFDAGDGLSFVEKEEELTQMLDHVKDGRIKPKTRDKVLPYSWEVIAGQLEQIYQEILN